ncbi:MAG: chitinase, partial [Solirubrobacteraceae bacterium]|nr:chitinase [Solirubrobacteraceae bacterium]
ALLTALLVPAPVGAYWSAAGSGTGTGTVETLGAGSTPTTSVSGQSVTVTWAQTSFHGGLLGAFNGGGYTVRRYLSTGGTAVTPAGTCAAPVSGSAATLSCTDTPVPFGLWRYTVAPVLGSAWTATESATSVVTAVVPAAPTLSAASGTAGQIDLSWPAVGGASGYNVYRRTTGSYYYATPLNGAAPVAGTTYADLATTNGTTYSYVVRAVGAGANGGTLESADSNEGSALADSTAPTGVVLTNPGSPLRGTVALAATASDTGTGIATAAFQYAPTSTSTWTTACTDATSPYGCSWATAGVTDGVYDLRVVATDGAGNTTTSATVTGRRIDNTAPAATLADPGALLRGTVTLTSTASDGGSGLASVNIQRAPAGGSAWTDVCTGTTGVSPCSFDTTAVADGAYDLRILAVDVAGNQAIVAVANRTIDNTRPTATDIQAANVSGGTASLPEAGDTVTFSFSEPIAPASVLAGWSGASTPVTVRISAATPGVLTVFDAANSSQLPLGSANLGLRYALAALVFNNSTMVRTGSTITVTLGTLALGGLQSIGTGNATLSWTTVATPTDPAGNALTAATTTESGTADRDF